MDEPVTPKGTGDLLVRRFLAGSTARSLLHVSFRPVWFVPEGVSIHRGANRSRQDGALPRVSSHAKGVENGS